MRFTQSNDDHNNHQRSLIMNSQQNLHRLLNRQIAKYVPIDWISKPEIKALIEAVNQAYLDFDSDISQLQHTIDLSTKELNESNQKLTFLNKNLQEEIELRTSEIERTNNQLLQAQEYAKVGSYVIDFSKQYAKFTPQAADLIGLTTEELQYDADLIKRMRRRVLKDDIAAIDEAWIRSFTEKCDVELDFRILNPETNEYRIVHWIVKPEYLPNGLLKAVSGTLQDISDRVKFEEKTKMAEQIISNSAAIFFKWNNDDDWTVNFVSDNIKYFGYDAQETIELAGGYKSIIHPDDLKQLNEDMDSGIANKQDEVKCTYRIKQKDGCYKWVEDRCTIIWNALGNVDSFQGMVVNINEQKEAEMALQKSEIRFQSLVSNSTDILTLMDSDGRIMYESPSFFRQFGYNQSDVIGKIAFEFVHPDDVQSIILTFSKTVEEENSNSTTVFRFKHKDGHYITLEGVGNNLLHDSNINAIVVNSRDITERMEAELKLQNYASNLEKINKELDQFAYIVSHDLKAPLRAINNLGIWIEEDLQGIAGEDVLKNLGLMRGRIHRMEDLINGILQYSRAGRVNNPTEKINIKTFVEDVIQNLGPKPEFKFEVDQNLPEIETERIVVDQVFSNYISNALKYNNNPEPVVKINYQESASHHIFSVNDNGQGIPEQFHEKVFVIFQTLQAKDKTDSTGVGLAIVKKLIEEKGGKVWLESQEGQGTTFFFSLPKSK